MPQQTVGQQLRERVGVDIGGPVDRLVRSAAAEVVRLCGVLERVDGALA